MSDGYEIEELTRIEVALDALVSPTSEDVFQATRPFDERAIASVAAKRAGSGGGGAQPSVLGPYTVNYNDVADETTGGAFIFNLADLAAGTVVVRAWAFTKIVWDDGLGALMAANMVITQEPDLVNSAWTLADYDIDQRGADYTGAGQGSEEPSGDIWPLVGWTEVAGVLGFLVSPGAVLQANLVSGQTVCGALTWTP